MLKRSLFEIKREAVRKFKGFRKYYSDPLYRSNVNEIKNDLILTRSQLGSWGREGAERTQKDRYFLVLSFTKVPFYAKFHAFIAKIAQLGGYTPLILNQSSNKFINDYYHLLGIDEVIYWKEFVDKHVKTEEVIRILSEYQHLSLTTEDLMQLKFKNVEIGKHALSMVCRRRLEGKLDFKSRAVQLDIQKFLKKGVESVLATEQLLSKYPVKKMLVRDSGYTPNGGIFETGLNHGVDCLVHDFGQSKGSWVFKRHNSGNRNEHFFSLSDQSWKAIKEKPWTDDQESILQQEFNERYKSDSLSDTRRLQHGKKLKSPQEVREQLGLDSGKKTAVIFSHIAWDAAFFYGTCLFGDFENWLFETVKYVAWECPELNWLIKLHPFNALKLQREDKEEESEMRLLRDIMPLPDHVRIMRAHTDINTSSLFPVIDYVLTVNGTVGMEFPCFGKPALLAGTGRYNNRGFTIDPQTKEQYFQELKNLHQKPPLSEGQIILAKKHYLSLMKGRQTSLESVIPMELRKFNEAQSELHNNISFKSRSLEEFESDPSVRHLSQWMLRSEDYDILNEGYEFTHLEKH